MKGRITMPPKKVYVPAKQGHFHQECQHWCFGWTCRDGESCRTCMQLPENRMTPTPVEPS